MLINYEIIIKNRVRYNKHILEVMEKDEDIFDFKNLVYIIEKQDSLVLNDQGNTHYSL